MDALLITGAEGFVGKTLVTMAEASVKETGYHPVALPANVDLRDPAAVAAAVVALQPRAVIHLAAVSFVPESFANPRETFNVNFFGTFNLLEALANNAFTGKFLYVSSGDVYGRVAVQNLPVREDQPLRPRNPYSVSKAAAEALCHQHGETAGFQVFIARPFNHIGPNQSDRFVIASFAKQIVEIKHGKRPPSIEVGDIDVTRDFSDVRDVTRAYLRLMTCADAAAGVYNVCSGIEQRLDDALNKMLRICGVTAEVHSLKEKLRPAEVKRIVGSNERLRLVTGWIPQISFEQSLVDIVSAWEARING